MWFSVRILSDIYIDQLHVVFPPFLFNFFFFLITWMSLNGLFVQLQLSTLIIILSLFLLNTTLSLFFYSSSGRKELLAVIMNRAKAVFMLHGANLIGANVIILMQMLLFWCKCYYFDANVIILMQMLLFWCELSL